MLNIKNNGHKIAVIRNLTNNKISKYLSVDPDTKDENGFNEIELDDNEIFEPTIDKSSQVLYICGARGSGKSRYAKIYAMNYAKRYRERRIYLFSQKNEDIELDSVPRIKRIELNESIYEEPFDYTTFEDSLVIFDDIDKIPNKQMKNAIKQLMDEMIHLGRSYNISVLMTNHDLTEGSRTKTILSSSDSITFFMHSGAKRQIEYLATNYGNITKQDLTELKKNKSRWTTIYKNYPTIILTERKAFIPE